MPVQIPKDRIKPLIRLTTLALLLAACGSGDVASTLPPTLPEATSSPSASTTVTRTLAASRCEHAWRAQRRANDWAGFLANFREVMRIAREEAELLSQRLGVSEHDFKLHHPGGALGKALKAELEARATAG